jgi:hypothetical protein
MRSFLLSLAVASSLISPVAASASPSDVPVTSHLEVPLVVIRFNEPRVYFERPLYNALHKALEAKPDVKINVINYFPTSSQKMVDEAEANLNRVMKNLQEMGMPLSRIGVSSEPAEDLKHSEVHIYVR